ncbi:hypothetical protein NE237_015948 [Protea cynaroides]|uniref:Hydroxymethylglutaryl-CoA reductase (NADPH) n=1 Tax=Protea cynaroides TaxID=273540 RepID=A0A9Q0KEZ5_9MAGN|nr:hypothetical protein NE237_015948 [Protea cynaroides]
MTVGMSMMTMSSSSSKKIPAVAVALDFPLCPPTKVVKPHPLSHRCWKKTRSNHELHGVLPSVGFVQIPMGVAGPLLLDGREYTVPMVITEGCLVASTNRGCKAIYALGGATRVLLRDGMTRALILRFGSAKRATELKFNLENLVNFKKLAVIFNKYV